jgi:predicted Fe-Mo cluster-binding NifX family protein
MKIAVSATGKELNSTIDPRFGRASYFVVVDSESEKIIDVINNLASQDAAQGAGINAGTVIAKSGAEVLLTGQVGPNALEVLRASGVKVIQNVSGTVSEAVRQYKKGTLSPSEEVSSDVPPLGRGVAGGGRGMGGGGRGRGIGGGGRGMGGGGGGGMGGGRGMGFERDED